MAKDGTAIGVDALLLGHPNSFYPTDAAAVEAYTEEVCTGTDLAVILFIVEHSNLRRLDVRGFPSEALVRMAGLETVVAVKYEVGREQPTNTWEAFTKLQKTGVLLSDPMEFHAPLWVERFGMQWIGTSNYEYYGDAVPRMMEMLCSGETEKAMDLYWQIEPARRARAATTGSGANLVHRYLWKFQAWLNGYNGGPLRQPMMKLSERQMKLAADGVRAAGIAPADEPFADFFTGRNP